MHSLVVLLVGLPQVTLDSALPLSELPDGEHHYTGSVVSELTDDTYLLLQKWGRIVVGVDSLSSRGPVCFKGFIEANTIVDATHVRPPYTADAEWDYQPGEMLDLSLYDRSADAIADADRIALSTCLDVFAR